MKQQIENIIKKNLPKIQEHICGFNDGECVCNCFQEALSQIDTALIADEVLKVIEEKTEKIDVSGGGSGRRLKEQLLSTLSPNKENE